MKKIISMEQLTKKRTSTSTKSPPQFSLQKKQAPQWWNVRIWGKKVRGGEGKTSKIILPFMFFNCHVVGWKKKVMNSKKTTTKKKINFLGKLKDATKLCRMYQRKSHVRIQKKSLPFTTRLCFSFSSQESKKIYLIN